MPRATNPAATLLMILTFSGLSLASLDARAQGECMIACGNPCWLFESVPVYSEASPETTPRICGCGETRPVQVGLFDAISLGRPYIADAPQGTCLDPLSLGPDGWSIVPWKPNETPPVAGPTKLSVGLGAPGDTPLAPTAIVLRNTCEPAGAQLGCRTNGVDGADWWWEQRTASAVFNVPITNHGAAIYVAGTGAGQAPQRLSATSLTDSTGCRKALYFDRGDGGDVYYGSHLCSKRINGRVEGAPADIATPSASDWSASTDALCLDNDAQGRSVEVSWEALRDGVEGRLLGMGWAPDTRDDDHRRYRGLAARDLSASEALERPGWFLSLEPGDWWSTRLPALDAVPPLDGSSALIIDLTPGQKLGLSPCVANSVQLVAEFSCRDARGQRVPDALEAPPWSACRPTADGGGLLCESARLDGMGCGQTAEGTPVPVRSLAISGVRERACRGAPGHELVLHVGVIRAAYDEVPRACVTCGGEGADKAATCLNYRVRVR